MTSAFIALYLNQSWSLVAVPIDLGVEVVAVQRLSGSDEIVVRVAIQIRERHEPSIFSMGPFRRA